MGYEKHPKKDEMPPPRAALHEFLFHHDRALALARSRPESVALLRRSAARGMTRRRMEQIWGRDFVQAVLEDLRE